ncbi:hypothetical protein HPB50_025009 [Hyalomma asiaticum]|uniref:Uncharacterized protein n=1 Tax=Hyalomma asiaticum TaxID=266040 RepID=A0ACB7T297_HYAAI|nr:hypothetical protein HPB50_025009 [Hyalomma asiaticum]
MGDQDRDVDCSNAARGVWLVKVPKYIASRWSKAPPMSEAGRLRITKGANGKSDIRFTLSDECVNMKDPAEKSSIPKEHRFVISNIANQNLAVFSQNKGKVYLEGHVVQKGECRPLGDDRYMQLKRQTIVNASQPVRQVKQLDRIVQNYKPVADHKHNLEFEQKKKAEGKKAREDKEKVLDMLFSAFEKHQYYNIKDLEKITRQPVPYLKEILKEICNYNAKNPHKNMWELKPEYRHYKDQEAKQ